jgi:hypothetical protein
MAAVALGAAAVPPASAWTPALEKALFRDAQRLVPESLAILMRNRETAVLDLARHPTFEVATFPGELVSGQLQPGTLSAFDQQLRDALTLMEERRVGVGLVRMGALMRIAADVSDPVLTAGSEALPPIVVSEYYAFLEANLDKIPVVLDDPRALRLRREELPDYWQSLLTRSREDVPVIRTELFANGRLVRHQSLDYRSPIFAVGSLAYSRAVNSIAATWLAGWRAARGDFSRQRQPRIVTPQSTETIVPANPVAPAEPAPVPRERLVVPDAPAPAAPPPALDPRNP